MRRFDIPARAALVLLAGATVAACFPSDSPFIRACEEAIRDTLRSPSTYKRIAIAETQHDVPLAEHAAARGDSDAVIRFMQQQRSKAIRFVAFFEYDSANAFGALIRTKSECSYETTATDPSAASAMLVRIDGKTKTDRLIEAVRGLPKAR